MRFWPACEPPGIILKFPAAWPGSPVLRKASCKRERLNCCTLPSARPTLPCLECILSIHPVMVFAFAVVKFVPNERQASFCDPPAAQYGVVGGLPLPRL